MSASESSRRDGKSGESNSRVVSSRPPELEEERSAQRELRRIAREPSLSLSVTARLPSSLSFRFAIALISQRICSTVERGEEGGARACGRCLVVDCRRFTRSTSSADVFTRRTVRPTARVSDASRLSDAECLTFYRLHYRHRNGAPYRRACSLKPSARRRRQSSQPPVWK